METETIILYVVGAAGGVWALVKVILPRLIESKLEASEYERVREAFKEDKMFDFLGETFELLRETLDHLKESDEKEKARQAEVNARQVELMQSINKMAAELAQHTGVIRVCVQQMSTMTDGIDRVRETVKDQGVICNLANKAMLSKYVSTKDGKDNK